MTPRDTNRILWAELPTGVASALTAFVAHNGDRLVPDDDEEEEIDPSPRATRRMRERASG